MLRQLLRIAAIATVTLQTLDVCALQGVDSPLNPTHEQDCTELSQRWSEKRQGLEKERVSCERRDGGTVNANGPFMPNCGTRQQAYVQCAPVSDQICWVNKAQTASVALCRAQVQAHAEASRTDNVASGVRNHIQELQRARENFRRFSEDPAGYSVERFLATPESARSRFQEALNEAARTTGLPGADSQPILNNVGEASERARAAVPLHPIAQEVGSQATAAARARMADALDQFDKAAASSPSWSTSPASEAPTFLERGVRNGDGGPSEDERAAARARLEMLRQMNETMQGIVNGSRQPSITDRRTQPTGRMSDAQCRELVGPGAKPPGCR